VTLELQTKVHLIHLPLAVSQKSFGETGSSSMVYNSPAVTSSNIMHPEFHVAGLYASMGHAQPADDSQGITYMTAAYSVPSTDDSKDTKLWVSNLFLNSSRSVSLTY
jgi:hypothetical protein